MRTSPFLVAVVVSLTVTTAASAQFPVARREAVSSSYYGSPTGIEYRREMAAQRRDTKRASERATWARIGALPPLDPEKRAAALLRCANTFGSMGKWELRDKWLARAADEFPATIAAASARFELGR